MVKREDLIDRVLRSVAWMERHLKEEISLSEVAAAACLSEYHFCRLFKSMAGVSPGLYLRRRRLSVAAENLLSKESGILELALEAGYETQESFTRAFKSMFGMPPGHLRSGAKDFSAALQPCLSRDILEHFAEGRVTLEPEFRQHHERLIRGIGRDIEIGNAAQVDRIWGAFLQESRREGTSLTGRTYGVCAAPLEQGDAGMKGLHYMAGYEVEKTSRPTAFMEDRTLTEGLYAVFGHKGAAKHIMKTVDYIWRIWLPRSSCELADSTDFEVYDTRFDHEKLEGEFEIWLPVKI